MVVSFKISKVGTRFRPKPVDVEAKGNENDSSVAESVSESQSRLNEGNFAGKGDTVADHANASVIYGLRDVLEDMEVSFSLNLFLDGFSVGKATEQFNDVRKQLYPYDRSSVAMFQAIEWGWLPGALFGNILCKYKNGAVLCEIRDYRNCLSEKEGIASAVNSPVVHKVLLRMCMENVIKDILSLSNDSWTYKDLLEVESYILKVLQPNLHLSPDSLLNRYTGAPMTKKLDLGITSKWIRRKLSDDPTTGPSFSGHNQRRVPCSQLIVTSSIPNVQKDNGLLESILPPNILTRELNYPLMDSCSQSVPIDLTSSSLFTVPTQCFGNLNSESREPSSLDLHQEGIYETQATQRPILKMPKIEPPDFFQKQPLGSRSNPQTIVPNNQLVDSCSQSVLIDLTSSNLSSVPTQYLSYPNDESRDPNSLVLFQQDRCKMQSMQRPIIRMPKNDSVDFSQQQPPKSHPNPLTMVPNYELLDHCSQIGLADLTSSNLSSFPMQCFSISNSESRQHSSLVLSQQGRSERQAIQRPIMKMPKLEPMDFSPRQHSDSQPNPRTLVPSGQLVDSCSQSVPVDLISSSLSSVPTQCFSMRNSESREPSSLILSLQGTCEGQAIQRPIIKMAQQESLDFSQRQAPGSLPEIMFAARQFQKNTMLHQLPGDKGVPYERFHDKRGLSQLISSGQKAILDGIPKLHAGMSASSVKQVPVETENFSRLNVQKIKDKHLDVDESNNLSNLQRLQLQGSSQILGMFSPQMNSPWNQMLHVNNMRKEAVTQKGKALQSPQETAGGSIAPPSSYQNQSLQRESSVPVKRKKNYCPKGSSTEAIDSLAVTGNTKATIASSVQLENLNSLQKLEVDSSQERFLKIREVTERCGLDRKHKVDKILPISFELWNSEESAKLEDVSKLFSDWLFDISMTRTLKFACSSHVPHDNGISMVDSKAYVKLVMSENRNEGVVEASVFCGHEGICFTAFPLLPTFATTGHSADLFAAQFSSLMLCEGYRLVDEVLEPTLPNPDDCSSTQKAAVAGGVPSAAGALELPLSTWTQEVSTSLLTPMGDSIASINCRQLPSKNLLSGSHLLLDRKVQSDQQISGRHLLRVQLEKTGRLSPEWPHGHQTLSK